MRGYVRVHSARPMGPQKTNRSRTFLDRARSLYLNNIVHAALRPSTEHAPSGSRRNKKAFVVCGRLFVKKKQFCAPSPSSSEGGVAHVRATPTLEELWQTSAEGRTLVLFKRDVDNWHASLAFSSLHARLSYTKFSRSEEIIFRSVI